MSTVPATSIPSLSDPLLARFFLTPQQKADWEEGKRIVKAFYAQQTIGGSSLNFFQKRNARWIELLTWAKGSQNMKEFLNLMSVSDANSAFAPVDLEQVRIAPQFVGTLVESMAKNKMYPCVTAIDDGSMDEKNKRLLEALYRMRNVATIADMQDKSGLHLESPNAFIPDDEISARVHFELEDRLPKEIRWEKMLYKTLDDIKFERVVNRKTLFDLIVLNGAAIKIDKVSPGEYTLRKGIMPNMMYNFFMNDHGELEVTEIGDLNSVKVKDLRRLFGRSAENPMGLTEQEIFDLARQYATNKNIGSFNYSWNPNWALTTYNQNRPYDDANVLLLDVEINCGEDVYYVEKLDAFGKTNITRKKGVPYQQQTREGKIIEQPKPEGTRVVMSQRGVWKRAVYAPYGDKLLYWGPTDLIINNYTDAARPQSSWTIVMLNNDGEYVPSLFERGLEPMREYQLTKLERKKLIAQIKPAGIRIDVESARNLDLGNGDTIEWDEVIRIYLQTGIEVYSSKGMDTLQREGPVLSNTVHDESIEKILGLSNVLLGISNELRELYGVPRYRDGADVGDRTANQLSETQAKSSYNVTDYVANGNNTLWEIVCNKLCLLHWNDVVKQEPETEEDILNTRFIVSVKMKITEYEKQLIENDIQRFSQMPDANGHPMLTPKDAIMLREIDNYKLACWYLASTLESNRQKYIATSAQLQAQNQQVQAASAQQTAQYEQQLEQLKQQGQDEKDRNEKQLELLRIIGNMRDTAITKGVDIPDTWKQAEAAIMQNVIIPVIGQNQQMAAQVAQAQNAQQGQPSAPQPGEQQEAPQEQMQPSPY